MNRAEWLKTPYAQTEAKNTDTAVQSLLEKYGVKEYQWTRGKGPSGRAAVMLRFNLKDKTYRMMIETLDVRYGVDQEDLIRQAYRALYYYLKSTLEMSTVFFPLDAVLFAFLELPQGQSMYEAFAPHANKILAADFSQLLLPVKAGEVAEVNADATADAALR